MERLSEKIREVDPPQEKVGPPEKKVDPPEEIAEAPEERRADVPAESRQKSNVSKARFPYYCFRFISMKRGKESLRSGEPFRKDSHPNEDEKGGAAEERAGERDQSRPPPKMGHNLIRDPSN